MYENNSGFGLMTKEDVGLLKDCVGRLLGQGTLSVLEVGVGEGKTARALKQFAEKNSSPISIVGVDSFRDYRAGDYPGRLLSGDSLSVLPKMNEWFDVAIIDGCHCFSHAMYDALSVFQMMKSGGLMFFHDYGEGVQGQPQACSMGNKIEVRLVVSLLDGRMKWKKFGEAGGVKGSIAYLVD